ncbi:MAG TPA: histidine kinase [Longimicrobiaceae bacterium]|nr:histidine kinase [Longimicrobiaceae bacterium]
MEERSTLRSPTTWALVVVWYTLFAASNATQFHLRMAAAGEPVGWREAALTAAASAYLWIPFTLLALWLAERRPVERGRWRSGLAAHLAAAVATVVFRAAAVVVLNPWVGWYPELPRFRELLVTSFGNNFFTFWLLAGVGHAVHFARTARRREAQLARAQLHALQAQLHPHFLFNALNTVSSAVRRDPDAAERMIARLSELLRSSLDTAATPEVPLAEELRLLESYLEIEQARFEDRLRVRWSIDPAARDARVPRLILQPLVENAVKHGIGPRSAPGTVEVSAAREDGELRLEVRDDGVGVPAGFALEERAGVGLANTRARLRQLYGDRGRFALEGAPGGGVAVRISIPFAPAEPAARRAP